MHARRRAVVSRRRSPRGRAANAFRRHGSAIVRREPPLTAPALRCDRPIVVLGSSAACPAPSSSHCCLLLPPGGGTPPKRWRSSSFCRGGPSTSTPTARGWTRGVLFVLWGWFHTRPCPGPAEDVTTTDSALLVRCSRWWGMRRPVITPRVSRVVFFDVPRRAARSTRPQGSRDRLSSR